MRTRDFEPLARAVVRCYPLAWRERYEDEMIALLLAEPVGLMQVLDLARGCVGEWRGAMLDRLGAATPRIGRAVAVTFKGLTSMAGSMLVGLPGIGLAMLIARVLQVTIGDAQGSVLAFQHLAWLGLVSILSFSFPRFRLAPLSMDDRPIVRRVVLLCLVCIVLRQWGWTMRNYSRIEGIAITLTDAMWLGMLIQIERGWSRPSRPPRLPDEIIQLRLSAP